MNTQTDTLTNGRSMQRDGSVNLRRAVSIPTPALSLFAAPSRVLASSFSRAPFNILDDMQVELDRSLAALGLARSAPATADALSEKNEGLADAFSKTPSWTPVIETFRSGDEYVLQADLPGMRREDVEISIHEGTLVISGERKRKSEEKQNGAWQTERTYGHFVRAFTLQDNVIQDKISASFSDGVLEIHLPLLLQPERVARKIEIK